MKILYTKNKKNKKYLIKDTEKDYHSQYGLIKSEDIKKSNPGDILTSNINEKFTILDAGFLDKYFKIKRGPQIIPLKDIGSIITMTGINKNSIVLEAGGGSGGLTCILGHLCKKVYSYDIRDDFQEIVKKNIEFLGLKNVKIKKGSIYENIKEREIDMISLDCPEPWKAINTVNDSYHFLENCPKKNKMTKDIIEDKLQKDLTKMENKKGSLIEHFTDSFLNTFLDKTFFRIFFVLVAIFLLLIFILLLK